MWFKSARPVALVASVLAYGAVNKSLLQHTNLTDEKENIETPLSIEAKKAKAREAIQRQMVIAGIPGLSVGVSVNGQTVWREGFGFANIESGSRCTGDSIMRIASISKPITAAIAARLVQEGKLDLDKSIQTYLPEFPNKKFDGKSVEITTRQLLSHTGGIRHYRKNSTDNKKDNSKKDFEDPSNRDSDSKEFLSNERFTTVTEALKLFKDDDLVAKPGTEFRYTTYGFTLVSAVLEKASGMKFKKLLEDLTSRLEMNHTVLDVNECIIPHRTNYYKRNGAHVLENCPEVNNSNKWAGGGILSNVMDLLTFANTILYSYQADPTSSRKAFLKKEIVQQLWKGVISVNSKTLAGLGWMCTDYIDFDGSHKNSGGVWYHTGGAVGASSVLFIHPTTNTSFSERNAPSGVCVVMLCNLQDTSLLNLAKEVEKIFRK
ncbi:hypothetical protein KIN20_003344 [Parelaphostrongylus tenuis]|uniref:Beta-lactamase-related domain-containing protein n=1 Tax=Parelaphostrongylus tenuis TaxID=148309 RepID=A0AAD5M011_PARTN|nr:hypothetical protein KIN20_003344 [Parelaphostrongylus tenuis]